MTRDKIPGVGFLGEGAQCPDGKHVFGGGAVPVNDNEGNSSSLNVFNMLDSHPFTNGDNSGWAVT